MQVQGVQGDKEKPLLRAHPRVEGLWTPRLLSALYSGNEAR